jgi:hypothetical protein
MMQHEVCTCSGMYAHPPRLLTRNARGKQAGQKNMNMNVPHHGGMKKMVAYGTGKSIEYTN